MNDEKLLPTGEPAPQTPEPSHFSMQNKLSSVAPAPVVPPPAFTVSMPPSRVAPAPRSVPEFAPPPSIPKILPKEELPKAPSLPGVPSPQAQSWGVVISIVIIVLMIVIGAFYAWGERIAQERALDVQSVTQ